MIPVLGAETGTHPETFHIDPPGISRGYAAGYTTAVD